MRICIAGKNNIAIDICSYVLEKYGKDRILVVLNKTDNCINTFQRSFKQFAELNGLTVVQLEDVYKLKDIIFLSLEFDRIIKPSLFETKKLYNIHFSLLPAYKGMYTSALPILNGERRTGVTLHCIDAGIDTGDIIDQKEIRINRSETAESLYLKYIENGVKLVRKNLDKIVTGDHTSYTQPILGSSYYSKKAIDYSNLSIDLNKTSFQIDCQIRAFSFRDYQMPSVLGFRIAYSKILKNRSYRKPGTLLYNSDEKIVIATVDYDIELYKDQFECILDCCKNNDIEALRRIYGLNKYIETKNEKGWTPLMVAAYNNSKNIFKYLYSLKANINAVNNNGTTVLMYAKDAAIKYGDNELIDFILQHGGILFQKDFYGKNMMDYLINQNSELYNYIQQKYG
ncbi:formyltransferase family protein [Phocaeicola sp.]